jgi:hypothetical protein
MVFSMKIYYFIIKLGKRHIILSRTLISYFISCKIWAGPEKTRIISYFSNGINKYRQNLYHSTCQKMTIENSYISHVSGWDDVTLQDVSCLWKLHVDSIPIAGISDDDWTSLVEACWIIWRIIWSIIVRIMNYYSAYHQ